MTRLRRGSTADICSDSQPHLPDLATSLNNQANLLGALGRPEDALAAIEEAVTVRRALAAARPTPTYPTSPDRS